MRSIKHIVAISLLAGILLASLVSAMSCYWLSKQSYLRAVDTQLKTTSGFINRLQVPFIDMVQHSPITGEKLQIQLFTPSGLLLYRTSQMPETAIASQANKFKTTRIGSKLWRTYRFEDTHDHNTIILTASISEHVILDYLGFSILYIIITTSVILGLIIFFTLYTSLRFLPRLSTELAERGLSKLEPINTHEYPVEIRPLLKELNQLFSRLQLSIERNKRFSADAAHELRTPLTALKTQAQLALQMNDPKEQHRAIENVLISVNRSIHIVQQLLTLSRLDHEQELNDVIPVNLETVCAEIIAFLYPEALNKNIEIELVNHCFQPIIMGNDASLGILMRNLVDNAIRYTPNSGKVEVSIFEKNRHIILRVSDNGPGIESQHLDKIYDRFYRVLGSKQSGSGLGLAIVKQIADLHHAKIKLYGNNEVAGFQIEIFFKKSKLKI